MWEKLHFLLLLFWLIANWQKPDCNNYFPTCHWLLGAGSGSYFATCFLLQVKSLDQELCKIVFWMFCFVLLFNGGHVACVMLFIDRGSYLWGCARLTEAGLGLCCWRGPWAGASLARDWSQTSPTRPTHWADRAGCLHSSLNPDTGQGLSTVGSGSFSHLVSVCVCRNRDSSALPLPCLASLVLLQFVCPGCWKMKSTSQFFSHDSYNSV